MNQTEGRKLIVVIRTAGERTFQVCHDLLARQVDPKHLLTVSERPFEAALRRCCEVGMESGAEWMLTVDADVLVRPGAVEELLRAARRIPDRCVQMEGLVMDKLRGSRRNAGHRIYRTAHLARVQESLPPDGSQLRPESWTLKQLSRIGFPSWQCEVVFGIHDYEQSYRDLYRKAFVHGRKHEAWVADTLPNWRAAGPVDPDLRVALRGYCDGFQTFGPVPIDPGAHADRAALALRELGIDEKPGLPASEEELSEMERLVDWALEARHDGDRIGAGSRRPRTSLSLGWTRLGLYLLGSALNRIGDRARRAAGLSTHRPTPPR